MANLELLITRYLDGELTPAERERLQRILAESPEARALLREMSALSRAARRTPLLHEPPRHLENALFAKLREEGLHSPVPETLTNAAGTTGAGMTGTAVARAAESRWYGGRLLRSTLAGVALLIAFIGDSYLCNQGAMLPDPAAPGAYAARVEADRGDAVVPPSILIPSAAGRRELRGTPRHETRRVVVSSVSAQAPTPALAAQAPPMNATDSAPVPRSAPPAEEPRTLALVTPEPAPDRVTIPVDGIDLPMAAPERGAHLAASFRPGVAMIDRGERRMAREMNLQIGMELHGGHQLSLIVGTAAALTETRHENTYETASSPARAASPDDGVASDGITGDATGWGRKPGVPLPEYELHLRSEPWVGVGYNYSISPVKGMSVAVGVNAGTSASAWRVGGELPVRYTVMRNISIEGAVSVAAINPRNRDVERFVVTDAPDHFVYRGSVEHPSFVSYGVQVGIRVDLPGNY